MIVSWKLSKKLLFQASNQKSFKAGEVSRNLGTSVNISSKTLAEKALQEKFLELFLLDTLKTEYKWIQSGSFFPNQGTFFDFQKWVGETFQSLPLPSCSPVFRTPQCN